MISLWFHVTLVDFPPFLILHSFLIVALQSLSHSIMHSFILRPFHAAFTPPFESRCKLPVLAVLAVHPDVVVSRNLWQMRVDEWDRYAPYLCMYFRGWTTLFRLEATWDWRQ